MSRAGSQLRASSRRAAAQPKWPRRSGAVAPHGVQGVGQAEEEGAGAAQEGEPEEGAEDGVVAVFQQGFHGSLGDAGFVQHRGVPGDDPAHPAAGFRQIAGGQGGGDGLGVFPQAAGADGEVEQGDLAGEGQGGRGQVETGPGQGHPGGHGQQPGEEPEQVAGQAGAARGGPAAGPVQAAFEPAGQMAETDQGMPAPGFPQQPVHGHGQAGGDGQGQGRGEKVGRGRRKAHDCSACWRRTVAARLSSGRCSPHWSKYINSSRGSRGSQPALSSSGLSLKWLT